ncbi:hypothetical protein [Microbulbifer celer]|uniref:Uncharacterized protein n=1 Tax=Microbulbifer celer TaxID=435905 RepID=A0ABW3U4Z1_9GAMM|nr:hypothetical protein [Microbulbifer celer]UFN57867.1 hypothetical protein LPW13_02135 [Microbulbifer celer]
MEERHKIELIEASALFDAAWYEEQYPDVKQVRLSAAQHYLRYGWRIGRSPSPVFCGKTYLQENADVREQGENPLVHYLRFGKQEGRSYCPPQLPVLQSVAATASTISASTVVGTTKSDKEALAAQLKETQQLLEKYFVRCEQLEYQLTDRKKQA